MKLLKKLAVLTAAALCTNGIMPAAAADDVMTFRMTADTDTIYTDQLENEDAVVHGGVRIDNYTGLTNLRLMLKSDSPLTIENGDFTLESGATFLLEVGKDDNGSVIADQLIVNGNAYFDDGSILWIAMDGESSLVGGDIFSATITANNAPDILGDVSAALQSYYFTDLSVTLTDPTVLLISGRLDPNAVPEPSTWALLILGAMGLFLIRKKNNR